MSLRETFPDIAITASIFAIVFAILYTVVTGFRVLIGSADPTNFTPNVTLLFISFVLYLVGVIFLSIGEIWSSPSLNGVASVIINIVYLFFGVIPLVYFTIFRIDNVGEPLNIALYRLIFLILPFIAHSYVSGKYIYDNYLAEVKPPSTIPT